MVNSGTGSLSRTNIIEFPVTQSMRMDLAIKAYYTKDNMTDLAEELRLLANDGFPEANFFLGRLYEKGTTGFSEYLPLPKDLTLALQHYEKAANELGYVEAYIAQGRLLFFGEGGVEKDLQRAKSMFDVVKDYSPVACFALGYIYHYGKGVKEDLNEAEKLYNMAIEKGNIWSMLNLATLYIQRKMFLSGLVLKIKGIILLCSIHYKNPSDERLRRG